VSLRLGKLLGNRRTIWTNGKQWRLSVEDPFEAYDSVVKRIVPHKCHPHPLSFGQYLCPAALSEAKYETVLSPAMLAFKKNQ
jgi:hypothetical protein